MGDLSDDEDDYMSEDLLSNIKDIKPGISSYSRAHQRVLKIEANRDAVKEKVKPQKKAELERIRLEEGLNTPICPESKGFSLLAKMGYKPGMTLGKQSEKSLKEPIAIQLKNSRTGLGHDTEKLEKQKERCMLHLEAMSKRAKAEKYITEDFRVRKRVVVVRKQLIGDLRKARKTCEELDIRCGREMPDKDWFWPIHTQTKSNDDKETSIATIKKLKTSNYEFSVAKCNNPPDSTYNPGEANETDEEKIFIYANGKYASSEEPNFMEFTETDLINSLFSIVMYLRSIHCYCVWCGCIFDHMNDLSENCPGPTRNHHDCGDDE